MADTPRTVAELQALLANNTTGDISPQDLRDFLVSALGECGSIGGSTAGNTGFNGARTKMSVFSTGQFQSGNVVASLASDKITVGTTGIYLVGFRAYLVNTDAVEYVFEIRRNGAAFTPSMVWAANLAGAGDSPFPVFTAGLVSLTAADDVELYCETSGVSTFDLTAAQLFLFRVQ